VGDTVFFHVVNDSNERSTVRGVYQVTQAPFFDQTRVWSSSDSLVYPYRFGFGAHPDFGRLAKIDAAVRVEALYREIEGGRIRSLLTLERETNGPGHAVKTLTNSDATLIVRLLLGSRYRPGNAAPPSPLLSRPQSPSGPGLASLISNVGRYEFAVKALLVYRLASRDPNTRLWIPACNTTSYDVLVESLIGPTVRKPSDVLCIGNDERGPHVTVIEAKNDRVRLDDAGQVMRYLDTFRARNRSISQREYSVSGCLLGQRFDKDLRAYVSIRNQILDVEPLTLVKYLPNNNNTEASFQPLHDSAPSPPPPSPIQDVINLPDPIRSFEQDPGEAYRRLMRLDQEATPDVIMRPRTAAPLLLERSGGGGRIGSTVIHVVDGRCGTDQVRDLMTEVYRYATQSDFDLLSVEPVLIARTFDPAVSWFLSQYNQIEAFANRSPIFGIRY